MKNRKSKKYHSVITKRIFHSVKKLSAVFLVVACATSLLTVRGTNAGFSDIEESTGNTFTATSLDARATYVERFSVTGMNPEQAPDQRITFTNVGRLGFRYSVKYRQTGGDATLCDAFLLTAERNGTTVYDQLPLKDFDLNQFPLGSPFEIARFGNNHWDFTVELPADADGDLENLVCQWDFDFTAWQTGLPDATQGFSDVEAVGTHSIATGAWLTPGDVVINEVMWMGSTASTADEWIELKNMTSEDLLLEGWKLDNVGSGHSTITLPDGAFIPANGYYLIANYLATSANSALNVTPDYVVNLSLTNSAHGNIVLKNSATPASIIDSALGATDWPVGTNGALKQSMERNDIVGDGLVATSWHTCVSGNCNDGIYWDTVDGNNFGTPLAANLSPIVMNEFVLNPVGEDDADRPDGEWIELYNILDEDIDVAGWYFTNAEGDQIAVTEDNTESGTTVVPGRGTLVVYLEAAFLDNTADTLSLYAPGLLPEDVSDDVREDTYAYEDADLLAEGKSYARFPDGEGIWIDPEATPGEENVMASADVQIFQRLTYDLCFENEQLKKDTTEALCSPIFLTYIGMLEAVDETKIPDAVLLDILEMIRLEEQETLAALFDEGVMLSFEEGAFVEIIAAASSKPVEGEENMTEPVEEDEESEEPAETVTPVEETTLETQPEGETPVVTEETPTETTPETEPIETPLEEETAPETEPIVEEEAKETPEAKVEEAPADESVEGKAPASETP